MSATTGLLGLAEYCQEMSEQLKRVHRDLCLPVQEITIKEAAQRLRLLLGEGRYFSIKVDFSFHRDDRVLAEWEIYVSPVEISQTTGAFYKGSALVAAVNAAIAAIVPTDPAKDAVAVLSQAADLTPGATDNTAIPF